MFCKTKNEILHSSTGKIPNIRKKRMGTVQTKENSRKEKVTIIARNINE